MVRVLCSTNYCTLLDAQHCRDRQTIATLRWENEALVAQVAQLAADNARLRAELDAARESAEFYMDLFCTEREATHGR